MERGFLSKKASKIFEALQGVKSTTDDEVLKNSKILDNENYFEKNMLRLIIKELKGRQKIENLDAPSAKYINKAIPTR